MSGASWLTLGVIVGTVLLLARGRTAPSVALLGAVVVLLLGGVITLEQAFAGFSSSAPITVAALFVLAAAVDKTAALQPLIDSVLDRPREGRRTLARVLVPAAGASAFLNNTPLVAMLAPQISAWAERRGVSTSRYLMPLSFATILGGTVTLMGTSTNFVVSGLLEASGEAPFRLFELTPIGLPVALAGLAVLILLAPVLLPERRPPRAQETAEVREFAASMRVVPEGSLDGQSVEAAGLRRLQALFLVEIERLGEGIAPVAPTTVLRGGDRLVFVGNASQVVELQRKRGLVSTENDHLALFDRPDHTFFEAVIGEGSPLVGRTLKEVAFRGRYQAAVLAIHRAGQRVHAKLGEVPLKVGDTLLLLADPGFRERWRDRGDFLLVARRGGAPPLASSKAVWVGLSVLAVVLVSALGLLPIVHASLLAGLGLVVGGVLSAGEARAAVDLDVIIVIAASFGVAAAVEASGLAASATGVLVGSFGSFGATGALLGLLLATLLLTELVTNNAAAALVFPIALATAHEFGLDPRGVAVAVAVAASASFLTPIGYQTNTMVYGPGGYRFSDYARLGAPLTLVLLVVVVALVMAGLY